MFENTRSRNQLSGTVRDYIMAENGGNFESGEVQDEFHEEDNGGGEGSAVERNTNNADGANPKNLLASLLTDPMQLTTMLLQSMINNQTVQKDSQAMQKKNQELMAQLVGHSQRNIEKKISICPKKRKDSSLDAWISEIKVWDSSNKETDQLAQKYLNFIESIRSSDEASELQKFVEANVVENKELNKEERGTIDKILTLIETNLGQSDLERST